MTDAEVTKKPTLPLGFSSPTRLTDQDVVAKAPSRAASVITCAPSDGSLLAGDMVVAGLAASIPRRVECRPGEAVGPQRLVTTTDLTESATVPRTTQ
jgi:hypothetical protein